MDYQIIISLLTLIALEVVLGIDNIIFISILSAKLPADQQKKARTWGILLAMVLRLGLLAAIAVIMKLDNELFSLAGVSISGKDLILILGGLFLIYKSTKEIIGYRIGNVVPKERGFEDHKLPIKNSKKVIMNLLKNIPGQFGSCLNLNNP